MGIVKKNSAQIVKKNSAQVYKHNGLTPGC